MKHSIKSLNFFSVFLFSFLMIVSCQKNDDNPSLPEQENIPDSFSEYFGSQVSRSFIGTVVNTNKDPLEGVTITIGTQTALTDGNGVFVLNNANINERFGYIKAEKLGYISGSRSVVPSEGTNKVTIMLLEANVIGTVNSGTADTVSTSDGSTVSFDGNFVKEDGSEYTGSVDVIMYHLDPTDEDMPMQMPGMLYAQNEDGAERMLQTLGMLAIELRGTNGEDLNLAEGSSSEIRIPVDTSLMGIAPSTIPLWYFDEVNGYWKEEGEATLQGNMYVGNVAHFSFWNCDIPAEAVTFCLTATNETNDALGNLWVSITSATFGTTYGYTNENGQVCGFVPSNETLELNVYSYDFCASTPLYSDIIGPFTIDSELSIVVQESSDVIEETVVGVFNTCDGNAVSDGYVQLAYGGQTFTDAVTDGSFEINLFRCADEDTFSVKGSDYVNLQTTDSISYTFTTPMTNIGEITACNTVTEFIQYTIDDEESVFIFENISANFYADGTGQTSGSTIDIFASSNNQNSCYYMYGVLNEDNLVGNYDNYTFNDPDDTGFFIGECISVSDTNNNISYNLNTLGTVGEYIDINFTGAYEDFNGEPHTIIGVVHVLRDN